MKILIFLITIIAATMFVRAGEIVPVWNSSVGGGEIQDMEILPGGDKALILAGVVDSKFFFIDTENGETIREIPTKYFVHANFELTRDSTRIIAVNGMNRIELRDLQTLELIDSAGIEELSGYPSWLSNTVIDPVRPIVYFTQVGVNTDSNPYRYKSKVIAYNYETMESLEDFTGFSDDVYSVLAISSDGKYLATINDGLEAYLKIWDLETNELIVNKPLFDDFSDDRCEAYDIYFSKNENNIVYFSGMFTQKIHSNDKGSGLFKFNMDKGTRELMIPDAVYGSRDILFFDNDSRCISSTVGHIGILNVFENHIEYYNKPPTKVYSTIIKYSSKNDAFISSSFNNNISKFNYDRETSIEQGYKEEITISPNPTTNSIQIETVCTNSKVQLELLDLKGALLTSEIIFVVDGIITFDLSGFSSGCYFIRLKCGDQISTYNVVKEG